MELTGVGIPGVSLPRVTRASSGPGIGSDICTGGQRIVSREFHDTQTLIHKHMDLQFDFSSGCRHQTQIDFLLGIGTLQQAIADCPSMMDGMFRAGNCII